MNKLKRMGKVYHAQKLMLKEITENKSFLFRDDRLERMSTNQNMLINLKVDKAFAQLEVDLLENSLNEIEKTFHVLEDQLGKEAAMMLHENLLEGKTYEELASKHNYCVKTIGRRFKEWYDQLS